MSCSASGAIRRAPPICGASWSCSRPVRSPSAPPADRRSAPGPRALPAEFTLTTLQGQRLDPARLKGRIVVVDFWATWCGPCRDAIPEIKGLLRKYPGERLTVLSISADQDEKTWRDFVARNGMTWPQYFDENGRVRELFGVRVFPTYLVIDGQGIVRGEIQGTDPRQTIASRLKTTLARFPELAAR
jgi:thiol-disulfide isomerase/thioredoxin